MPETFQLELQRDLPSLDLWRGDHFLLQLTADPILRLAREPWRDLSILYGSFACWLADGTVTCIRPRRRFVLPRAKGRS